MRTTKVTKANDGDQGSSLSTRSASNSEEARNFNEVHTASDKAIHQAKETCIRKHGWKNFVPHPLCWGCKILVLSRLPSLREGILIFDRVGILEVLVICIF